MEQQNQSSSHSSRFIGLRVKLIAGFTILFTVIFALTFLWFDAFSSRVALNRIEEDLIDTLNGTIAGIDGDEFARLAEESVPEGSSVPSGDLLYQQHQTWLGTVMSIEPRSIPYTFVPGDQPYEVLWIGDSFRIIRPESMTSFRESYIADPANTMLYQGLAGVTANMDAYSDQWGTWVSAYGPIRDSAGAVVGGVGIDFRADYVAQVQRAIRSQITVAFVIALVGQFLLVWLITNAITRSTAELTQAAERIGEGDYEQDLSNLTNRRFPDEISTLAQVFELMMAKVRTREQTLKQQVAELRIEIDEAKRSAQVSEIVDSDFFQDLQLKARQMRAKRVEPETVRAGDGPGRK